MAGKLRNRNHPARRILYGSNVNDEMADIYLQVTPVHPGERAALMEHYKKYEFQSLIVGLTKSLDVYPDDPWILEGIAGCNVGLGKPKEAIAVLERRLKTGPTAVFPVVSLGMAVLASLARDALSQLLKCDPENWQLRSMCDELRSETSR